MSIVPTHHRNTSSPGAHFSLPRRPWRASSSSPLPPPDFCSQGELSRGECEPYSLHFASLIRYLSEHSQDTHRIRHHRRVLQPCQCLWRQPRGSILTFLCYASCPFWPQSRSPILRRRVRAAGDASDATASSRPHSERGGILGSRVSPLMILRNVASRATEDTETNLVQTYAPRAAVVR